MSKVSEALQKKYNHFAGEIEDLKIKIEDNKKALSRVVADIRDAHGKTVTINDGEYQIIESGETLFLRKKRS